MSVPAFLEIEPDNFKPIEECSEHELWDYVHRATGSALMTMRAATEQAEDDGVTSPITDEEVANSMTMMREAEAVEAFARGKFGGPGRDDG